jgi:hypothetical protein
MRQQIAEQRQSKQTKRLSNQCSGSGSAWTRIDLALVDPDPSWECGSGSGFRSKEIGQINKAFVHTYIGMFMTYYLRKVWISCQNSTSRDDKNRSESGSGSTLVLAPWIRIRFRVKAVSGSALKPVRMYNTVKNTGSSNSRQTVTWDYTVARANQDTSTVVRKDFMPGLRIRTHLNWTFPKFKLHL